MNVARTVNPEKFGARYESMRSSSAKNTYLPMVFEGTDVEGSYFKWNVNVLYLYNLVRLEESNSPYMVHYQKAYKTFYDITKDHMNAHFNMIDRALMGPGNVQRDQDTIMMLDQLGARGFKHTTTDVRGKYASCGENRACEPVPVSERTQTDFMWQTPPWDLYIEGDERIEGPGLDFLLPYWMSRFYKVQ